MPFQLSHDQVLLVRTIFLRDQAVEALVVDLEVINLYLKQSTQVLDLPVDLREDIKDSSGNDSVQILHLFRYIFGSISYSRYYCLRPQHGESLSRSTLAVSEKRPVEPLHELPNGVLCHFCIHFSLRGFGVQHVVESVRWSCNTKAREVSYECQREAEGLTCSAVSVADAPKFLPHRKSTLLLV